MTDTIYNLYHPKATIDKGLVEIIDVYGGNYYTLAVDGQVVENIYKDSFESTVLKRSFIKNCCKISGVDEESLTFVIVDWYYYGNQYSQDYDSNDYLSDYSAFTDFIKNNNIKKATPHFLRVLAVGVTQLEEAI